MPVETRLLRSPFRKTVPASAKPPRKEFIATITVRDKPPQQDRLYKKKRGDTLAPKDASVVWRDLGDGFGRREFFRLQRSDVAEPELMTKNEREVYVASVLARVRSGELLHFSSKTGFQIITMPAECMSGWVYCQTNGRTSHGRRIRCVFTNGQWWSVSLARKTTVA